MKLIKTTFYSAIITLIRISSGFVANKIIAVFTGPSGVAIIGQFTNFVAIVFTVSNGAINNGIVKYTAEYDDTDESNETNNKLKKLFSTGLAISIFCSFFFGIVLFLLSKSLSILILKTKLYENAIKILGITIIFYSLNSFLISILNGKKLIKQYTLVNTIGSIVGLIFTTILVYKYKIDGALYSIVLSQSVVFFTTLFITSKNNWFSYSYFTYRFDKIIAKKLLLFSLMALVSVFTAPVVQILLRDMIINKINLNAAGYWQGMMRISDGYLLIITTALSTYYLPKLSSLKENKEIRKEIILGYKTMLPAVLIGCIIIYFSRTYIINLLYTSKFIEMENLFFYQLIGDFFKIASWILAYLMLAKAMTKLFILTEILFSILYLILGYVCTELFGIIGITIAFTLNYFIYFIFMLIYFRKLLFVHEK